MKFNTEYYYNLYKQKGGILSYEKFKEILFSYNKKAINKLISSGKVWMLRSNLGFISIAKYKKKFTLNADGNLVGAVDWNASNKLKAEIEARGEVPFQMHKDEAGKIIGDNGGVKWLCYHMNDFTFGWTFSSNMYLTNSGRTVFKITWSNSKKLSQSISNHSELLYKDYEGKNSISKSHSR